MTPSTSPTTETVDAAWDRVPGQVDAVTRLRAAVTNPVHAYLFVGPEGSGKRAALRAFAGELFAADVDDPIDAERHRRLAAAEHHPDLVVIEPEGAIFRGGKGSDGDSEAAIVIREAHRSPVEATRKVVAAIGFHSANDTAVGALLKTLEEPPARTTVVLLAETVPPNQSAIASRCVRIDFNAVEPAALHDLLVSEGIEADRAELAVASAGGSIERARVLATDDRLALRIAAWQSLPGRLDGTGATATRLVNDLRAMMDDALAPVVAHHEAELATFEEEAEAYGLTAVTTRRNALKARHKRIERQSRTTELRVGLAVLARAYRDAAVASDQPEAHLAAVDAILAATRTLALNPNETLTLVSLFWGLPSLAGDLLSTDG